MKKFKITDVQIFDYKVQHQVSDDGDHETEYWFSANVVINDDFIVQCGTKADIEIPQSHYCFWKHEYSQNNAADNFDLDDIIKQTGIEVSREWFMENHTPDLINPDDAPINI